MGSEEDGLQQRDELRHRGGRPHDGRHSFRVANLALQHHSRRFRVKRRKCVGHRATTGGLEERDDHREHQRIPSHPRPSLCVSRHAVANVLEKLFSAQLVVNPTLYELLLLSIGERLEREALKVRHKGLLLQPVRTRGD